MYIRETQIFMMFFNNPPSNPKDWLLSASVTHGSIMLDPGGCTVQDAQVKGAAASVVRGGAIVPDDHHLLWTLKVSDRANMALSAILLAPLPIWPPDNSNPNPLHHQPAASGRHASNPWSCRSAGERWSPSGSTSVGRWPQCMSHMASPP